MTAWRPQHYERQGRDQDVDPAVLANALASADQILAANARLTPVFTLAHLAHLTDTEYGVLRGIAERSPNEAYRLFRIRKRPSHAGETRFRTIAVPSTRLLKVQRWITQSILKEVAPHSASVAFSKGDTIYRAAESHCGCAWLIKMDVRNFFESISEISVYRVFRSLGYQPLVSLEMARLCTRMGAYSRRRSSDHWRARSWQWSTIKAYEVYRRADAYGPSIGHLPQGAPTSPMLANLAMRKFDAAVTAVAKRYGLIYTRYADDLTFSTSDKTFSRKRCSAVIDDVYRQMERADLSPNITKTKVSSPGSRKIVLGLLVNGPKPRLTREFRALMRQHLHYLLRADVGPVQHARARGFISVVGFRNHLTGLATYARQIDEAYGDGLLRALDAVAWPL
jgi:RNA-directed DNA polymerase